MIGYVKRYILHYGYNLRMAKTSASTIFDVRLSLFYSAQWYSICRIQCNNPSPTAWISASFRTTSSSSHFQIICIGKRDIPAIRCHSWLSRQPSVPYDGNGLDKLTSRKVLIFTRAGKIAFGQRSVLSRLSSRTGWIRARWRPRCYGRRKSSWTLPRKLRSTASNTLAVRIGTGARSSFGLRCLRFRCAVALYRYARFTKSGTKLRS